MAVIKPVNLSEIALKLRELLQDPGIDDLLTPQRRGNHGIRPVALSNEPAEAGTQVVQQIGSRPKVQ